MQELRVLTIFFGVCVCQEWGAKAGALRLFYNVFYIMRLFNILYNLCYGQNIKVQYNSYTQLLDRSASKNENIPHMERAGGANWNSLF